MRKISIFARQDSTLVVIILLSIALGFSLAAHFLRNTTRPAVAASPVAPAENWRNAFVRIAEELKPSVVNITSEKTVEIPRFPSFEDFFNWPFGPRRNTPEPEKRSQTVGGTGFIVRSDGYIMTNNHVVEGADRVTVKLADGRQFTGKVLLDPYSDLAIVKIDAKNLPAMQFADSDKVRVGDWVAAIGNPFGLEHTLTAGVVSAVRRGLTVGDGAPKDVIQTDASINPGNSGGPLVDLEGRVVGVNFAIYTTSGGSVGVGFAIASDTAKSVMTQLIEKGKVERGYLGVLPIDLTPVTREKLGVDKGALVESVDPNTPAGKAGIKVMDVIISVGNKPVNNASDLRRIVQSYPPGSEVKIVIIRDKKEKTITVKLGELPVEIASSVTETGNKIGLSVQPLTPELAKQLNVDENLKGVVVRKVEPGSSADRAGIRPNDVITEIEGTPITSVASFSKAIAKLKSGDTALVVVQRGERSAIIELRID
ncbi:MAG: Do family serine endopeptidase [Armatimonadetes bacterium]|nr:Do family serine endopeptidase [Armatimonadota bacterium]